MFRFVPFVTEMFGCVRTKFAVNVCPVAVVLEPVPVVPVLDPEPEAPVAVPLGVDALAALTLIVPVQSALTL